MLVTTWGIVPHHYIDHLTRLHDVKDIEWYSGLNVWFAVCIDGTWYFVPPPSLNKRRREWCKFPRRPPFKSRQLHSYVHFPGLNLEKLRVTGLEMPRGPVVGPR